MRPEQQTTIPENPHVHFLDLVLFCLEPYFIIVKQENKVQHVNLCILNNRSSILNKLYM